MARIIRPMSERYAQASLDLIGNVFTAWRDPEEGRVVRALTEEIRSKKYYVPELELVMVDETDQVMGSVMFSRFPLEGKYEDRLLLLTPVAVRTDLQRQHISKELVPGALERISGAVDYSFYQTLA